MLNMKSSCLEKYLFPKSPSQSSIKTAFNLQSSHSLQNNIEPNDQKTLQQRCGFQTV